MRVSTVLSHFFPGLLFILQAAIHNDQDEAFVLVSLHPHPQSSGVLHRGGLPPWLFLHGLLPNVRLHLGSSARLPLGESFRRQLGGHVPHFSRQHPFHPQRLHR